MCMYTLNIFVTFQSQFFFASQAFVGFSLASLGLMARPLRSCDHLDDDHVTAIRPDGAREKPVKACEAKKN